MLKSLSPSLLTWLRSFEAAARLRSITAAAEELCITQGAVSQQVRQLEKILGFPLLIRHNSGLELTSEGGKLAPVAQQSFTALRDAVTEISSPGGMVPVTLSCSPSFAIEWLTPRLSSLLELYPQLDLRVFGEFHGLNRNRMGAEGLEAAIRYDLGIYDDLRVDTFLEEYLIAVASPAYLQRRPQIEAGAELDGRFLLHDSRPWVGAEDGAEWANFLSGANLTVRDQTLGKQFNLSQLAVGAAMVGEGIAIGRVAAVLEYLKSGRLRPVVNVAVRSKASYHFVTAQDRPARILAIHRWLMAESAKFQSERDGVLESLSIRTVSVAD